MMGSWRTGPGSPWKTWYGWRNIWEDMTVFMKFTTLSAWFGVFFLFLVETKTYYRIDVFKGVDTPVDDIYGELRNNMTDWYKNL
jgi:hypothetical protein